MLRSALLILIPLAAAAAEPAAPVLDADSYNQWKDALKSTTATPAGEIRALPGFRVELVRSAQAGEGSWVAMVFDPAGRVIVSREEKGLLRMTVPPVTGGGEAAAEVIDNTLAEVRGLTFLDGDLYANANNSRALVRLRDADGDGSYEERTTLKETPGGVGHGRNQLAARVPDSLWTIHGDDVGLPADYVAGQAPFRNYRDDRLLPASWDRFHGSNGVGLPCGHLIHSNANGSVWRVYCGGLRNPFGIAFNEDGEPFTYDADMEWDVGLPWYRPTRVIHLVSGADYGWRGASRALPAWMPDTWPAVCDIGKGSPTAVMFGTRSTFPAPWRDALFALDWAYGIIHAAHLTPHGSTYTGRSEVFLQGRPLNVTSLDFGPDGAMYFVTGGRRTQSGLYRVSWTGEVPAPEVTRPDSDLVKEARTLRRQRRELELLHAETLPVEGPSAAALIKKGLVSRDPPVRRAARVALERFLPGNASAWLKSADEMLRGGDAAHAGAMETAIAAARAGSGEDHTLLRRWICGVPWADLDGDARAACLRALQLSIIRHGPPGAGEAAALLAYVESAVPCGNAAADQLGAELLVSLGSARVVERFLPLAEAAASQEERMHFLFALRHVKSGWTPEQRKRWIAAFATETAQAKGAHHLGLTFRYARADFEATLTGTERAALSAELAALDPAASAVPAAPPRPFVRAWTQAELEPHLGAVGEAGRDLMRGRELFTAVCAACHRSGAEGGVIGPDLTGIAGRFDRRAVLESIIDPWRVVAEPYRFATAALKSGEIVSGRIVAEDGENLRIEVNPVDPDVSRKVPRGQISSLSVTSQMLPGLANSLSLEELLDLLAFLESGGAGK